jgi:hypothetical protein
MLVSALSAAEYNRGSGTERCHVTEDPTKEEPCRECEDLRKARDDAYRDWSRYRPQHTDNRPKSRWFKADRDGVDQMQLSYNMARAKYELHLATHDGNSIEARDAVRNYSIIVRQGRLKP